MYNPNNFFFSYFYYRLYHLNSNKGDFQGFPAAAVITLIQSLAILDVGIFIMEVFVRGPVLAPYARQIAYSATALGFLLLFLNYKKYNSNFDKMEEKWRGEARKSRRVKGLLIALTVVLVFVPLALVTKL
ncbi:hypothetical protein D4L85_23495 [Chryseolinea soli]|uniref:Uncharacterized protein n=1 Tax=Chryseolinea soli TaxID=2321403 RepID=A0A385ST94_9BACT|nr:hypothetical protein D4L85_23495 [Chryseolinea soli]